MDGNQREKDVSGWSKVSPGKAGRTPLSSSHLNNAEIQISASKYSALSIDEEQEDSEEVLEIKENEGNEVEEGEFLLEEDPEERDQQRVSDSDLLEDEILAQQVKGREKVGAQKGQKRGQKAKAQDANPSKSTRPSRRKH